MPYNAVVLRHRAQDRGRVDGDRKRVATMDTVGDAEDGAGGGKDCGVAAEEGRERERGVDEEEVGPR